MPFFFKRNQKCLCTIILSLKDNAVPFVNHQTNNVKRRKRFFNTAGPCVPGEHYMIDKAERFVGIHQLIHDKRYFILHAPRQTGKTTGMLQMMEELNNQDDYITLYVNVEAGQAWRSNIEKLNQTIINEFRIKAKVYLPQKYQPSTACFENSGNEFGAFLTHWCLELPKPLVLFMDEVDALIGDGLISVLRQLRAGYTQRPKAFPHAMCIIGLRDIRDYRIYSDSSQKYIVGGSAFNIKEQSLRIKDFTFDQVKRLYQQHTDDTGQVFSDPALDRIFYYTQGQPWLVNALGRELCFGEYALDTTHEITPADVDEKVEILIARRDVHLDQLADKLTEPRVANVIEAILVGENDADKPEIKPDDRQYLIDLGLVRKGIYGLEIANPIYREVVPRELTAYREDTLGQNPAWYVLKNGKLDIEKVLDAYIEFYKEHHELVTKRKTYTEAAHHLLFMAWLQRIVNGGGSISREYAAGLGRLDLCIDFAGERFAFELKLSSPKALENGCTQLAEYLNRLSLDSGRLIIFSRKEVKNWDNVGKKEIIETNNKKIKVIWL